MLVFVQARLDHEETTAFGELVLEFEWDIRSSRRESPPSMRIEGSLFDADGCVNSGEDHDDINRATGGKSGNGFAGEGTAAYPAGVGNDAADPGFLGGVDLVVLEKGGSLGAALVGSYWIESAGDGGRANGWVAWFGHGFNYNPR